MNLSYFKNLLSQILCDIKTLKESLIKKISILFNSVEVEDDVISINFTGSAIESVETLDGVTTVTIEGGVPTPQVQSDWNETNALLPAFILNKPVISGGTTTASNGLTKVVDNIVLGGPITDFTEVGSYRVGANPYTYEYYMEGNRYFEVGDETTDYSMVDIQAANGTNYVEIASSSQTTDGFTTKQAFFKLETGKLDATETYIDLSLDFSNGLKISSDINNITTVNLKGSNIILQKNGLQFSEYADDAAAAIGGVPIDGLYRTGSILKIRIS